MTFAGASADNKADEDEGEAPMMLRFIDENKTLKLLLRKADTAFRVDSISSYVCGFDSWVGGDGTCGADKCWDDDNTLATAYTACTACTDYTGYYTMGTFRTEATGVTFDSRVTSDTYGTYMYDTTETTEKENDIVESDDERRDEVEEISGMSGDDASADATVVAANLHTEKKKMGPKCTEIPIIPPIAIEFNSKEKTIPWKDYSDPTITPLAVELTEGDYFTSTTNATEKKKSRLPEKVKNIFTSGLRKSSQASI